MRVRWKTGLTLAHVIFVLTTKSYIIGACSELLCELCCSFLKPTNEVVMSYGSSSLIGTKDANQQIKQQDGVKWN